MTFEKDGEPNAMRGTGESKSTNRDDFELSMAACDAVDLTSEWLLSRQTEHGYWCGELEGDSILESEYILLLAWMGKEHTPNAAQAARYLLQVQQPSGGWSLYPGGPLEISASVKAYFALKLTGHDANADYMIRAQEAIRAAGGADAVNSFTRFYLALLGQLEYKYCPAVPPEVMLAPRWSPINIYRISAWSRTIFVPLAIMWSYRPTREIPKDQGISELFLKAPGEWGKLRRPGRSAGKTAWFSWTNFFHTADSVLKGIERCRLLPLRRWALSKAEAWIINRFAYSDGLGAIFPPIIFSLIALRCRGYEESSPEVIECLEQLDALILKDKDTVRLQPCKSPVWDTAISLRALQAAGSNVDSRPLGKAAAWLLSKEVTKPGDWAVNVKAEPAGWYFEHNNEFYPDVDDTIMVMMALRGQVPDEQALIHGNVLVSVSRAESVLQARGEANAVERISAACMRARQWLLAMQNRDGGWGAFDRDNDRRFLCEVPFADHNAMIDPSTPDITARTLECLAQWGLHQGHPAVDRAVAYVRKQQEPDGAWPGRWGVNYIYGVWQCLVGLRAVGVPVDDPAVSAGIDWLRGSQQPCGGWGESPQTYADPTTRGQGEPTASQTAWAVLGLLSACGPEEPAVRRGVGYLVRNQRDDGAWDEPQFTGTGFPLVFYLRYHLYPIYFPLLALAEWNRQWQSPPASDHQRPSNTS